MNEYIIVGDTEEFGECLVYICGMSEEHAKEVLNRMLTDPTEIDKSAMQGHTNLRIKEVEEENRWWRHGCD